MTENLPNGFGKRFCDGCEMGRQVMRNGSRRLYHGAMVRRLSIGIEAKPALTAGT